MEPFKLATPELYLVGRQEVNEAELSRFLVDNETEKWETDATVGASVLMEIAGRVCYDSFGAPRPGGNVSYTNNILESRHGSVTEHAAWQFILTGVSRSLTHELVRHRVGMSPSQRSQRYVDESEARFVCPPEIEGDPDMMSIWRSAIDVCRDAYKRLVGKLDAKLCRNPRYACRTCGGGGRYLQDGAERTCEGCNGLWVAKQFRTEAKKAARGAARSVMPNATETVVFLTFNARAMRHFVELRASPHADYEIRRVANLFVRVMGRECPALFSDYRLTEMDDGTFVVETPNRKV